MGKLRSALCLLCLLLLIPALLQARRILPLDTHPLVAEKYAGWTGVLNLWIYEGCPCGSGGIAAWLNQCIASFEKTHPGAYIQPQFVDAGAITSMNDSGIIPPDMLLFPPGLLSTPAGLIPLEKPRQLRKTLSRCGEWNGSNYAVPVAMGGYVWAWNTDLAETFPEDWRDTDAVLSVPAPQSWRRWDAALLALCSGRYAACESAILPESTPNPAGEVELGLPGGGPASVATSPEPQQSATLSRHLPAGFQYDEDAWRHFINGECAAMPVTQREICRLQALSDQGKGPRWQLKAGDNAFSDLLLCLAAVDRPEAGSRQSLCLDFLALLLSDECQSALCRASAFAVTDAPSGYGPTDALAIMDAALREPLLAVPPVFDVGWMNRAEEIVRKFIANTEEAPKLWARFRVYLTENTND